MKKVLHIIFNTLAAIILFFTVLPLILSLILQINFVQNFIVDNLTKRVSKFLETTISVRSVDIKFLYKAEVEGFLVEDPTELDTLLYVDKLSAKFSLPALLGGNFVISKAEVDGGLFLLNNDSTLTVNMKVITDKFKKKDRKKKTTFSMRIDDIEVNGLDFEFRRYAAAEVEYGINFQNMRFNGISTKISDFHLMGDSITMEVKSLGFTEKSGTKLNNISAKLLNLSSSIIEVKDAKINLDGSVADISHFAMHYKMWTMSDFINKVSMDVDVSGSTIDFATIAQFTGKPQKWRSVINFSGTMSGTISNMGGQIRKASTHATSLENITYSLEGLPNVNQCRFKLSVPDATTTATDVSSIIKDFTGNNIALPKMLSNADPITLKGNFDGLLTDYKVSGNIGSSAGSILFDIQNAPTPKGVHFAGKVSTQKFNLGHLTGSNDLGNLSLNADIDAYIKDKSITLNTKTLVKELTYMHYNYRDIRIDGNFLNSTFTGYVGCKDPNLWFDFDGSLELTDNLPQYNFSLDVKEANLAMLNLNQRDSVSTISGIITAAGYGNDIDNINGSVHIDNLKYINHVDTVNAAAITLRMQNSGKSKYIRLNSSFIDAELKGIQSYHNIPGYFRNTIRKYLPALQQQGIDVFSQNLLKSDPTKSNSSKKRLQQLSLQDAEPEKLEEASNGYYIATLNVKKANNVAAIFLPGLDVAEGTKLSFLFNPALNLFTLSFSSAYIATNKVLATDINIDSRSAADSISLYARASEFMTEKIYTPNLSFTGGVKNNNINLYAHFANKQNGSQAMISTVSEFINDPQKGQQIKVNLRPSYVSVAKQNWQTNNSYIVLDTSGISVKNLSIFNGSQRLGIDGFIAKNATDTMSVKLSNVSLSPLDLLTDTLGFNIGGTINGGVQIISNPKELYFISDIDLKGVSINNHTYADAAFISRYNKNTRNINFNLSAKDQPKSLIDGWISSSFKEYHAVVALPDIDLSVIQPFLNGIGENTSGEGSVNLTVSNPKGHLELNGKVDIPSFITRIAFTNTLYSVKGTVEVKNNQFSLQKAVLTDELGSRALFEAGLTNTNFKNVNYFIHAVPNKMLCMNTTVKDNDLFYGRIFATGDLLIKGAGKAVTMNVTAKTENQSTFNMPLSNKTTMNEVDFIRFVKPEVKETISQRYLLQQKKKKIQNAGTFNMNLNISVLPNTYAQIVIDPTVGDIIKARGTGQFNITARPADGVFTINGGYEITEGSYLFTLRSVINKLFTIKPGSSIMWSGDPLDAKLNVTAIYKTKTALAPLLGDEPAYRKRVEVDCNMTLSGRLLQPDIKLGITVPGADPETQGVISSALNTEEAISMQLFWLLFANSFFADSNSGDTGSNINVGLASGAAVTGVEFLSNQISNWLSSDKFNLGINYRPKGNMTSDEVELSVSAPILKDKLFIDAEGNYDFNNNSAYNTENFNALSGDFSLTWMLDRSGNLSTKAFSRQINTFDENQGLQESGVGIYYKEDFNRFGDLVRKYRTQWIGYKEHLKTKREEIDSLGREEYRDKIKTERKKEREEYRKDTNSN